MLCNSSLQMQIFRRRSGARRERDDGSIGKSGMARNCREASNPSITDMRISININSGRLFFVLKRDIAVSTKFRRIYPDDFRQRFRPKYARARCRAHGAGVDLIDHCQVI